MLLSIVKSRPRYPSVFGLSLSLSMRLSNCVHSGLKFLRLSAAYMVVRVCDRCGVYDVGGRGNGKGDT